jgi:pimeloyl-ACP methyl ester carboxylesterase
MRLDPKAFSHSVTTPDGAQLHVERLPSAQMNDGPPLLFLHGGMGTLDDWVPLAKLLSERALIAMDARGHGASTAGTLPLTYAQLEADAVAVLDALSIPRAVVMGFSDGGIVAYRLALNAPDRVHRLITLGGPCRLSETARPLMERATPIGWDAKFPETRKRYERLNPKPHFETFMTASKRMWLDESDAGYPNERVRDIRQPTMIIRGDRDELVTLEEAIELRQMIEGATLLHVPLAEHDPAGQVEIVAAGVRAFLRS